MGLGFLVLLGLLLLAFWIHELVYLLSLPDDVFPGRYDKILWFCVVFFAPLLGALIFYGWRTYTEVEAKLAQSMREALQDASRRAQEANGQERE